MESLMMTLLQNYCQVSQWNHFENQSATGSGKYGQQYHFTFWLTG